MADEFFILSLRWTREDLITWWCAKNSGYTSNLAQAGRYARADVENNRAYYDNGQTTLAIPCVEVEACADLVVRDLHLPKLTGKRLRMKVSEGGDPCPTCGDDGVHHRLGLEVVGPVVS